MGRYSAALNMPRITSTIVVAAHNTVIRRKRIIVDGTAIDNTGGWDDLLVEQCYIKFNRAKNSGAARGIWCLNAARPIILECEVINAGAPDRGPLLSTSQSCIYLEACNDDQVRRVTLRRGSTGLQRVACFGDTATEDLEGHDFRGPYPRGQLLQFNTCTGTHAVSRISDESIPGTSWNEDSINVYNTPNVTIDGFVLPMQSDGLSGRGFVLEIEGTINCTIRNGELFWTYNGAGGAFQTGPGNVLQNIRVKHYNLYSARAIPGSSNSGSTQCALCVTGFNPVAGLYTTVSFIYFGMPARTPNGTVTSAGIRNTWYNPNDVGGISQGTGTVTEQDWTPTLSVVRNRFPWRSMRSKPSADLPPRVNSYWHDGRISTTPIPGTTILGLLPGRYKHDPKSRSWQWRKNGVPIVGATGINYLTQVGDSGWFDCVEVPSNDNGDGPAFVSSAVYVA